MQKYAKAIVALIMALSTWGVTASEDDKYTQGELWGLLLAVGTSASVYLVPNRTEDPRGPQEDTLDGPGV